MKNSETTRFPGNLYQTLVFCGLILFGALLSRESFAQGPVGTAFTYQGILSQSGSPADGKFDFQFSLYNAVSGGARQGSVIAVNDAQVDKGRFTVDLNFGQNVFANAEVRWLEIAVRPGTATGAYTTLAPRQPLKPAPYAITALSAMTVKSAPWSALTGVPAGLNDGDNDTLYAAGAGLKLSGAQFSVNYAGTGSAATAARSDHSHGQYLTPLAGDARYLAQTGPATMNASSTSATMTVNQDGTGAAATLRSAGQYGLSASTAIDSFVGSVGVLGYAGNYSGNMLQAPIGVLGEAQKGIGVLGRTNSNFDSFAGVWGENRGAGHGVFGYSVNNYGGRFTSLAGKALYADGSATVTKTLNVGDNLFVTNNNGSANGLRATTSNINPNTAAAIGISGLPSTDNKVWIHAGLRGETNTGLGVLGISDVAIGTLGQSKDSYGVLGRSDKGDGVRGISYANNPAYYGGNFSGGGGVYSYAGAGYAGYFTATSNKALYANGSATVTLNLGVGGDVTASKVKYSTPRMHYLTVPYSAFQPVANVAYNNLHAAGGAYVEAGTTSMVAPIYLPDGAQIVEFTVFFYDQSARNLNVSLERLNIAATPSDRMATIDSSGISGFSSKTTTTINPNLINNATNGYNIEAWTSAGWDSANLRVMGARVKYQTVEPDGTALN